MRRSMTPELPDDPEPEQVDAWVELAELAMDDGFRGLLRRLVEEEAAEAGAGWPCPGLAAVVREVAGPAVAAGIDPGSAAAAGVVEAVIDRYAGLVGGGSGFALECLPERLRALADPRRERYLELLAIVNGWSAPESWAPVVDWLELAARRSATGGSAVGGSAVEGSCAGSSAAGRGGW
ncbi:hypothetical protein [Streptomyces kaniharaensis]|uniref:hypothetical protein n=1 Tax=Streptomyces kaniharaensis TaxID=212423 RepID=UPI002DDD9E1B|nr:hypothetical protein [Streptomyces kaniharaensis]